MNRVLAALGQIARISNQTALTCQASRANKSVGMSYIQDMAHIPLAIANEFIRLHGGDGSINHMKIQKLVYLAQGWWLAVNGNDLVSERPQVWRYGPVFESLYRVFSPAGRAPIMQPRGTVPFPGAIVPDLSGPIFDTERSLVEWVWGEYGHLDAIKLSDLTHAVGTPWRNIAERNRYRVPLNTEIPRNEDWEYFARLVKERGANPVPLHAQAQA